MEFSFRYYSQLLAAHSCSKTPNVLYLHPPQSGASPDNLNRITVYTLHTIQLKQPQITIVVCPKFSQIVFLLRETAMETQLALFS